MLNRRITLSDVAAAAGVSAATASAVLSGKEGQSIRVSRERRRAILDAAASLGYVPNTAAQQLKAGDDNHIIAVFTYENIFPADPRSEFYLFFAGIQQEAEREGYDILILNNWGRDKSRSSRIRLAAGAIMIGVTRDDRHITSLVKQDFPLVFVGRREIGSGLPVRWVTFDYEKAVGRIVELVAPFASGSIVYVSSPLSSAEPSEDKSIFLHNACARMGIKVIDMIITDSVSPQQLAAVLEAGAVVFDRLFIADIFTSAFRGHGISIGKDIHGAILEDDWTGTHGEWTVWENRRLDLGALSAKYLISLLAGKDETPAPVSMPVIVRQSAM